MVLPPLDGSLFLPEILDFNYTHNPDKPFYYFCGENSDHTTQISRLEFVRACYRVAHIVRPDRAGEDGQVVAIIAGIDTILYHTIALGVVLAGWIPFPISPRNSPAAVINLLKETSCHHLITTQSLKHLVDTVENELALVGHTLTTHEVPLITALYPHLGSETESDDFVPYPRPTERPHDSDVAFYLHSSGSTGFPKPIPQTQASIIHWAAFPSVSQLRTHVPQLRMGSMSLPPFHIAGFICQILIPLFSGEGVCLYPPTSVANIQAPPIFPTSDNILDHTRRSGCNIILVVPSFLEIWEQHPEDVEFLKTLEIVAFAGAPLVPEKGRSLAQAGVKLQPVYGCTEMGVPVPIVPSEWDIENKNWEWVKFSPRANIRWVPQGDRVYEFQALECETHRLSKKNLADVEGYSTSDLWEKHPTEEGRFRFVSRLDDVLILTSGEKTVPLLMESTVTANPLVRGAVMLGHQRSQTGILIEPIQNVVIDMDDDDALEKFRNEVWPQVEKGNQDSPAFGRIFKEMILVTHPDRPLPRTPKGTILRKQALKMYEVEIEALYKIAEASAQMNQITPPLSWTDIDVEHWLVDQATDIHPELRIDPLGDLFLQGFDSLSATHLRNRTIGALRSSDDDAVRSVASHIPQNVVYSNPTIKQLAGYIANAVIRRSTGKDGPEVDLKQGVERIEQMIERYSVGLDGSRSDYGTGGGGEEVVLLTGSTGGLGSHLLAALLRQDNVRQVYAFNRPSTRSVAERQSVSFEDRGLDVSLLGSTKLVYVEGVAEKEKLGLDEQLYEELRRSTTLIIHNAWRLDFNLSLSSFESNIRGTRNLIDFALSTPQPSHIRFIFTSSIAVAQAWNSGEGAYPEDVQSDARYSIGSGYGEGKYVAERIIAKSGLRASSIRIGQLSGGSNGAWATMDWVPILIKSSVEMGCFPDAQGNVTWIPMHTAASSILDAALSHNILPIALNLIHPRPVSWSSVMDPLRKTLLRTRDLSENALSVVSFQEWFSVLDTRAMGATQSDVQKIPAIKLLDFFGTFASADETLRASGRSDVECGGLNVLLTDQMKKNSRTMRELEPIGVRDVEQWVRYWTLKGMFD